MKESSKSDQIKAINRIGFAIKDALRENYIPEIQFEPLKPFQVERRGAVITIDHETAVKLDDNALEILLYPYDRNYHTPHLYGRGAAQKTRMKLAVLAIQAASYEVLKSGKYE